MKNYFYLLEKKYIGIAGLVKLYGPAVHSFKKYWYM